MVDNVVTNQAAIDKCRKRDCLARNILYSTIVGDFQETLKTCMTEADMWTLVTIQQLQSASQNQQYVQTLFFNYQYTPGIHTNDAMLNNKIYQKDLTSFSYPVTHNARGGHYQARGGRTRRGFRGGHRGDRQGGRLNNRSHDEPPSKRKKMYCEYCTRDNHYVDTCRIRQRHERERGMKNGSHNNEKVSNTKGNPQLELLST